jgi:hypothetical protein
MPGTEFYEQVRHRMVVEGDSTPDWAHTAENRLLFQRDRYSTLFYRWAIRWFHLEWKDAWLKAGRRVSQLEWMKTKAGLWLARAVVNLMARMPGAATTRFRAAEGA